MSDSIRPVSSFPARLRIEIDPDPGARDGMAYLERILPFLPNPQMVDVTSNLRDRVSICAWIGKSIAAVNLRLKDLLTACDECFEPVERRSIQILAVPFAATVTLDGFCNLNTTPATILVDVGRVAPADWLALVAHEYAHAHVGYAGHDLEYARILSHLCLGLGLPQPPLTQTDASWFSWPLYPPTLDPLAFWRGESDR